jgi:hypothetical protein
MTGQVESSDFVAIQAETIWASLKEQPESKPITLEKLLSETDGISIDLGEIFSKVVNKLCNVSREETTFLSGQSEDKSQTLASQTSDSAKNSGGPQANSPNNPQEPSNDSS